MTTNIIIQNMTEQEAQAATVRIKTSLEDIKFDLADVFNRKGWKSLGFTSMKVYMTGSFPDISYKYLHHQLQAGRTANNLESPIGDSLPESVLRPMATATLINKPKAQKEIWAIAETISSNGTPKAKHVEQAVEQYEEKQTVIIEQPKQVKRTMNRTNDNIEWARWSWNPITGCLHNCDYCYARDIAERFYPQGFEPTYHPDRLEMPSNTKVINEFGGDKVFTCSMADLFGKWVPVEWITEVLATIASNPQWTFLLLTKFPIRMAEFSYPPNVWLGTTVDRQHAVDRAESAFKKIKASGFDGVCWLSCEPMLERLTFSSLDMFDWVVMGGASKSSKTPEYKPPFEDVIHLYDQARASDCQVYMKTNLLGERVREYPK